MDQLGAAREAARVALELHHEQVLSLVTKHVENEFRVQVEDRQPMSDPKDPGIQVEERRQTTPPSRESIESVGEIKGRASSSEPSKRPSSAVLVREVQSLPGEVSTSEKEDMKIEDISDCSLAPASRTSSTLRQSADVSKTAVLSFDDEMGAAVLPRGGSASLRKALSVESAFSEPSSQRLHCVTFLEDKNRSSWEMNGTHKRMARADEGFFTCLPIWRMGGSGVDDEVYDGPKLDKIMNSFLLEPLGKPRMSVNYMKRATLAMNSRTKSSGLLSEQGSMPFSLQRSWTQRREGLEAFVVHPYAVKRAAWDVSSLILVVYDIIMIPLDVFNLEPDTFLILMAWFTRFFWTIDIPCSCFTGYVMADGSVVTKPRQIVRRYAQTWFPLDLVIVGVDWIELFLTIDDSASGVGYARVGRAGRTFRILRMVRLLRLVRMREVFDVIAERINSETLAIVVDISKITLLILGMAHCTACAWYGIANMGSEDDQTWLKEYKFHGTSFGSRYTMSMHWSLSQFAGGMDEITPESVGERVFAMIIFLIAFVVAAVFVSSITSSMTQLNIIGSQRSQQLSVLRRYLTQSKISSKLALRVQRNAQHAMNEQQRLMPESSVELLTLVSEPLRSELHFEMYSPIFSQHPFFSHYTMEAPQVMRKVCHYASAMSLVSSGDVIFSTGEIPAEPKMYVVCSGTLQYTHDDGMISTVEKGRFLAEATLWTKWMHRGVLTATSDCRLCTLDATKFQVISGQFSQSYFNPKIYAAAFVDALNQQGTYSDLPLILTSELEASAMSTQDIANSSRKTIEKD